jgi:hypothetical protein
MLAYHNDPAIKAKYLKRVRAHQKADRLVQGTGAEGAGENFRGCAVGCTLEVYDHSRYPIELGIPQELARLEDRIFEGLPVDAAMKWPAQFLSVITPGADLTMVWPRFSLWLLETELGKYPTSEPATALYRRWIAGNKPGVEEWRSAADAAYAADAAADAAYAARAAADAADAAAADAADADAYAAYAAYAAADAADAYAADAAADAAAYAARAARKAFWNRAAKQLLKLLRAA